MNTIFKVGDKVRSIEYCVEGTITELEDDFAYVEFHTNRGGGTLPFPLADLRHLEKKRKETKGKIKKYFGYCLSNEGEKMVGVVLAKDIEEAKKIISQSFHLNEIEDSDLEELHFNQSGICELYYGC